LIHVPENIASATGKSGLPIKMLHDRLLVALRKEDGDRRSSGGILIPATAQVAKRLIWGEARAVGGSVRQVKVGDQVLFSPEDQHEVHGEDLIILRERDVHAVAAERIEESTGLYL
jgi:chaperonin GroES